MSNRGPRLRGSGLIKIGGRCNRELGGDCRCFRPAGHAPGCACSCATYGTAHRSGLGDRTVALRELAALPLGAEASYSVGYDD